MEHGSQRKRIMRKITEKAIRSIHKEIEAIHWQQRLTELSAILAFDIAFLEHF